MLCNYITENKLSQIKPSPPVSNFFLFFFAYFLIFL